MGTLKFRESPDPSYNTTMADYTQVHRLVPPPCHSSIDLQVAVLRHLPSPVLVLGPQRKSVFVNRKVEVLFGNRDPIQGTGPSILGLRLGELGVELGDNGCGGWDKILDGVVEESKVLHGEGGCSVDVVREVDVVIGKRGPEVGERYFRTLVSTLTADDGIYFTLLFERSSAPMNSMPTNKPQAMKIDGVLPTSIKPDPIPQDGKVEANRDIGRIKRSVFDSCETVAFILTLDENFYLPNKKTVDMLGDILGDSHGSFAPSIRSKLEIWDENFSRRLEPHEFPGLRLVRARKPFEDYRCGFTHHRTGERIVMSVTGECLYDEETGEFLGGVCWCRDLVGWEEYVTEKERRTVESHETICNLMPHLVWTTTPEGMCDWFSKRWYDFTGMTEDESVGEGFATAIHPDDLPVLMSKWNDHREKGMECEVEIRYRRKDSCFRWMLARACPLWDDNGKILKWYGTNTDIHELVMARIEAARNKLQILTVLAHAEVNMFAIDKNGKVTMAEGGLLWDSLAETYQTTDRSTLLGKDAIELGQATQPGGVPGYEKSIKDILSGKVGVAQCEDKIGERVYRTRVVADLEHNSEDGAQEPVVKGVLGMSIDVTDMSRRAILEVDNTRLMMEEQAAKDSNRMKSQFLANMSHVMRTPTAGVIGMVELLGEDPKLTTDQREYVNSIQLSAKALLTIVNDILDFSKIESSRLDIEEVPFNLSDNIGELCKLLSMFAQQKGLQFIYENSMDLSIEVLGDPGRTRQVLSNLLTNALKFTEEGSVKLCVSAEQKGKAEVEATFLIEDTGIGIEKQVLDKLFRPFSQGDASTARLYGGTGLGLTISRNLADLMHGSISLTSTPNVGSRAIFTIPLKITSYSQSRASITRSNTNPTFRYHDTGPLKPMSRENSTMSQVLLNQQIGSTVNYTPNQFSSSGGGSGSKGGRPRSSSRGIDGTARRMTKEERGRVHVLVVEDNAINQTIAIKNIRRLGFTVTAVWNGREALSYLLSPSPTSPRPDIILMDVQMPIMDGHEATQILQTSSEYNDVPQNVIPTPPDSTKNTSSYVTSSTNGDISPHDHKSPDPVEKANGDSEPHSPQLHSSMPLKDIPVIAMTASAIQGDREKCYAAGMEDYLAKPVERERLEEMLVKWAGRRRDWDLSETLELDLGLDLLGTGVNGMEGMVDG